MGRVDDLTEKIQEYWDIHDSRGLTSEEAERLEWAQSQLGDQLDANYRQAVAIDARRSTQAPGKSSVSSRWYHLRLSMVGTHTTETFNKLMEKMAGSKYVDQTHPFVYVYEQSGVDADTRGRNPHVHVRFRSNLSVGRLVAKIKRASGLGDPAIKLCTSDNVNSLRQYMLGNKSDPAKSPATQQDKYWRMEEGLKMEYIIR